MAGLTTAHDAAQVEAKTAPNARRADADVVTVRIGAPVDHVRAHAGALCFTVPGRACHDEDRGTPCSTDLARQNRCPRVDGLHLTTRAQARNATYRGAPPRGSASLRSGSGKTMRRSEVPTMRVDHSSRGRGSYAEVEAGYVRHLGKLSLPPSARLRHVGAAVDGFEQTGDTGLGSRWSRARNDRLDAGGAAMPDVRGHQRWDIRDRGFATPSDGPLGMTRRHGMAYPKHDRRDPIRPPIRGTHPRRAG